MNSRFLLLIVVTFLAGASLFLWLRPAPPPVETIASPRSTPPATQSTAPRTASDQFLILAASWQPAFCEGARDRPECTSQGRNRFDADHFSLHGLWPRDQYCGVSAAQRERDEASRWSALPAVELDPATRRLLDEVMPGTRSLLERHEWIKHGTCFSDDPGPYFATSILLLAALNASPVRELFAANIGNSLSRDEIRGAFDAAFGPGAGNRVRIACEDDGRRRIITELTIGLYGSPGQTPNLGKLMLAANPTDGGCEGGIVDAVGLQ
jgi:ribonuclease T2